MSICAKARKVTFITWLTWCLQSFYTVNSLLLPFIINTYLVGRHLETMQILFPIKILPTNFSMHRSLLPEPVVAMMPTKWWFSKSIVIQCWRVVLSCLFTYLFTFLFTKLFICTCVNSWIPYSVGYLPLLSFFLAQIVPDLATSTWFLCFFNRFPSLFSTFLLSNTERYSRFILFFSCPSPAISPRNTGFYWRIFRNQDLEAGCAHCYWGVTVSWALSGQAWDIQVYAHTTASHSSASIPVSLSVSVY